MRGEEAIAEGSNSGRVGIASGASGVNSWWLCSSTMTSIGAFTRASVWLLNWVSGTDGAPAGLGQWSVDQDEYCYVPSPGRVAVH